MINQGNFSEEMAKLRAMEGFESERTDDEGLTWLLKGEWDGSEATSLFPSETEIDGSDVDTKGGCLRCDGGSCNGCCSSCFEKEDMMVERYNTRA